MAAQVKIELDDKVLKEIIKAVGEADIPAYTIADGVEYGIWQEFTKSGHPSLVPAFERVTKDLPQAIGQAIEAGVSLEEVITKAAFDIQALWQADVNVDTGSYKNSIHVETE